MKIEILLFLSLTAMVLADGDSEDSSASWSDSWEQIKKAKEVKEPKAKDSPVNYKEQQPYYNLTESADLYIKYLKKYKKSYKKTQDLLEHYDAFKDSLKEINEKNEKSNTTVFDWSKMSDYTTEKRNITFGYKLNPKLKEISISFFKSVVKLFAL